MRGMVGCVLSNELLDAMPVHQLTVEQGRLREVYVTLDGQGLLRRLGNRPPRCWPNDWTLWV